MTESASTPRLRITFAVYLALVVATAFIGPTEVPMAWMYTARIAGFICVTLAVLGRVWSSVFIAGHKDESLVTTGPYAACRHPLYSCSILGALGLGLTSESLLLCALVLIVISALVLYAASCEEQFLADAFPEQFKSYVLSTPNMWWPKLRAATLPVQLDVRPAVYRKAFVDGASFFLLYLLVSLAADYRVFHAG